MLSGFLPATCSYTAPTSWNNMKHPCTDALYPDPPPKGF
jgi:hypothetical protein